MGYIVLSVNIVLNLKNKSLKVMKITKEPKVAKSPEIVPFKIRASLRQTFCLTRITNQYSPLLYHLNITRAM